MNAKEATDELISDYGLTEREALNLLLRANVTGTAYKRDICVESGSQPDGSANYTVSTFG